MSNSKKIRPVRKIIKRIEEKIQERSALGYVASDPTRLKIMLLLRENEKLCTSAIAKVLGLSASAVSHQKTILERHGLIESGRQGKTICCRLKDRKLAEEMLKGI